MSASKQNKDCNYDDSDEYNSCDDSSKSLTQLERLIQLAELEDKQILECGAQKYYSVNVYHFITEEKSRGDLVNFTYLNRDLNTDHIDNIEKKFDPTMCGAIQLTVTSSGTLEVLDGQHRIRAIRNIGDTDKKRTRYWYIAFKVVECDDENKFKKLFDAANNQLTVTASQLDKFKIVELKDAFNKEFTIKKGTKYIGSLFNKQDRKQRPFISTIDFISKIKGTAFYSKHTTVEIIQKMNDINDWFLNQDPVFWAKWDTPNFTKIITHPTTSRIYKTCTDSNFVLGSSGMEWATLLDYEDSAWRKEWTKYLGKKYFKQVPSKFSLNS